MGGRQSGRAWIWAMGALLAASIAVPAAAPALAEEARHPTPATAYPEDVDIDTLLADAIPEVFGRPQTPEAVEPDSWLENTLPPEVWESWTRLRERLPRVAARGFSAAKAHVPPPIARKMDQLAALARRPEAPDWALQAAGGMLALFLLARLLRGRGCVTVTIEYPPELRGTYSLRLSTRKPKNRLSGRILSPAAARAAQHRAGSSSRTEHHLVSRETQFREILAGHYFITADGFLQPPEGNDILTTHYEIQEIDVSRRRTVRLTFDFHPKNCSIEVTVLWDRRPVTDAKVSVYGQPSSLRIARGGPVRIGVTQGSHTLIVGSGDRIAQVDVDVVSFTPTSLEIDLANREHLLFSGCPPAAEAYLLGDVPATTRALERDGLSDIAHLILARVHLEHDDRDTAARHFEQGGRLVEAAELRRDISQLSQAARLFERAGELERAAKTYRAANEASKAGETYQRAGQFAEAADCFRECGDRAKRIDALEKSGEPFEAAKVAIELDDWPQAIRCLQKVTPADPAHLEAVTILAKAYERAGHLDLAIETIEQIGAILGDEGLPLDDCSQLATLLEKTSQFEQAIEILETLRRRDVSYPGVATRIEELRKLAASDAAQAEPADPAQAGVFGTGPRYDILEEVGRGGMGVVFKARDRRLGRIVALKRLTENLRNHPKAQEMFLREARAAAALNHPNIVTLFDVGQEGDAFFITMEFLEGSPLQAILKKRGRLTARDAARLGMQISAGLHYAEDQRIVHRDIKTANLFFTKKKVMKIMDFGLAKMIEEVRRGSTMIGGTPYYMAPEQSRGERVDHRCDLYALGVTFFELLTGRVPFPDGDVAYHHRHTPAPDPREIVPEIPEAFAQLILKLMAKRPSDRPSSNAEVGEQLSQISRSAS